MSKKAKPWPELSEPFSVESASNGRRIGLQSRTLKEALQLAVDHETRRTHPILRNKDGHIIDPFDPRNIKAYGLELPMKSK